MTEEQQIELVESALDRHAELIAEAREAYQVLIDEDYINFTGNGLLGFRPHHWAHDALNRAEATLGQDAVAEIWDEEMNKFGMGKDPEIWRIYSKGTDEEKAALEHEIAEDYYKAREAMDYWGCKEITTKFWSICAGNEYSEETDISGRMDYARAFYGEKP